MAPHRLTLPHLPPTLPLHISAYTSVTNSSHLLSQLQSSNPLYNYTFIDARTLLSTTHLLAACFRACTEYMHGRLKSNNVHSEVVLCLSRDNNVGEALRRFGVGAGTREVVVIRVCDGDGDGDAEGEGKEGSGKDAMKGLVEGVEIEWGGVEGWLGRVCDLDVVRGYYKIGAGGAGGTAGGKKSGEEKGKKRKNGGKEEGVVNGHGNESESSVIGGGEESAEDAMIKKDKERKELERVVLGLMALRGAT